jgi:hypothetical protein
MLRCEKRKRERLLGGGMERLEKKLTQLMQLNWTGQSNGKEVKQGDKL